jgi:hypothetical protein
MNPNVEDEDVFAILESSGYNEEKLNAMNDLDRARLYQSVREAHQFKNWDSNNAPAVPKVAGIKESTSVSADDVTSQPAPLFTPPAAISDDDEIPIPLQETASIPLVAATTTEIVTESTDKTEYTDEQNGMSPCIIYTTCYNVINMIKHVLFLSIIRLTLYIYL